MCTLLSAGLDLLLFFKKEENLRYKATEGNKLEVERLLKKGVNLNAVDEVSIVWLCGYMYPYIIIVLFMCPTIKKRVCLTIRLTDRIFP